MKFARWITAALFAALPVFPVMAEMMGPETLRIAGPEGPLEGTYQGASGVVRATALIIPGSGPTDRDGNNPLGVSAAPYRMLAEALAPAGIATIRIDKRGMFGSAGAVSDANAVTLADYAGDIHAWVQHFRQARGAACVWLIGHSEGGLVAMEAAMAAAVDRGAICGVVLLAAPGRRLGAILRQQLGANPANAPLMADANRLIATLEAGRRVRTEGLHPALAQFFRPAVQGYLMDVMARDPAAMARALDVPLLVVQGEADLQVTPEDAWLLAGSGVTARPVLIPGMNHVLKSASVTDRAANLATYARPDLPLADGLVQALVAFMGQR